MSEQNRAGNGPTAVDSTTNDQGTVEQARERFTRVADEVRGRARRTGDDLRRGAEIARERASATGDQLREGYHQVEKRARVVSSDVNDFVQEHPGRSVLLAAGIGFLVGLLVRRGD
jgi:ElaB/YqjD/DUF883 family membrane-anchored ribosome-binding protein